LRRRVYAGIKAAAQEMKKPDKTPKGFSKRLAFFEDRSDVYRFLNPIFRVLFVAMVLGLFMGLKVFFYILGLGAALTVLFFIYLKIFAAGTGFLYHGGSSGKDHKAVIKGMYNLANGYRGAGEFEKAENAFHQILVDYPEELDARYYLAQLYDLKFDNPEKALAEYRRLKRKILELNTDYRYEDALEERINELKEHLGHDG